MGFAVLGSSRSMELLQNVPGYLGGIRQDNPDSSGNFPVQAIPSECRFVLVELAPSQISFLHKNTPYFCRYHCVYFERQGDLIRTNTALTGTFQEILNQYQKVQMHTQGTITHYDASAIVWNVLSYIQANKPANISALEVGSWTGCSSYFLTRAINSLSTSGKLCCLDTWRGNDFWAFDVASHVDIFANFRGYMTCYGAYEHIIPLVADSSTGFQLLKDNSFDIIFIGGDHRYDYVKNDIRNALRKIKPGGLLLGHDCSGYADDLPPEFIQANLDKDCAFLNEVRYSCGVLKALRDFFGTDYSIFPESATWYKTISAETKSRLTGET